MKMVDIYIYSQALRVNKFWKIVICLIKINRAVRKIYLFFLTLKFSIINVLIRNYLVVSIFRYYYTHIHLVHLKQMFTKGH